MELYAMQSLRPSNEELVRMLYAYTALEVAMRRTGHLRAAVRMRQEAREIGRMIRYRIEVGQWDG